MTSEQLKLDYFVDESDLTRLRTLSERLRPEMPAVLDAFYAWMSSESDMLTYFTGQTHMDEVKRRQLKHWEIFFEARLDEAYINSRVRVGERHARIGLSLDAYFRGVLRFNDLFEEVFLRLGIRDGAALSSFHKMVNVDVSIVVYTYADMIKQMEERNNELATPVAELWDGILFLPLVGSVDAKRASQTLSLVLKKIAEKQSRAFIMDIAGISSIDTAVVYRLLKIVKAARLMGCRAIVSGISPEVAQTTVELGIDTGDVDSTASMTDALRLAFDSLRLKVGINQL